MAEIKGLLFDKDGTVLDFYKTWGPINRDMAFEAAEGDAQLAAEILRAGGHDPETNIVASGGALAAASVEGIVDCFAKTLNGRGTQDLHALVAKHFREGGAKYATLIDGAVDHITALGEAGYRLGIATNDTVDGLHASFGRFEGLLDLFAFTVASDSGHGSKPAPGMGLAFAEAMSLEPAACAIIGDSKHDLEMGRIAGFGLRVGVLTGPALRADLMPHADIVIDSVRDLARALRG
ncbi:MAG: HAD family hydrolase [Hyphomicrobium sp.]